MSQDILERAEAFIERWEGRSVEDVDTQPTQEMADIASTVLEKIDDEDLDNDECGTRTGLERANQLENREDLSPETIGRMVSFFARHDGNQEVDEADNKWEDCGFVSWQLWGGDPGREWAERKMDEIEEAEEDPEKDIMSPEQDDKDTRKVNQLTEDQLKKISKTAGTEDAPKVHKGFQINSKDVKVGEDEDGNPVYEVPISGDAMDRDQDQMAIKGQEHMVKQLRTGKIPVFGDHGRAADAPRYSFTNIIGQFIDGRLEEIDNQEVNEGEKVTMAKLRPDMEHEDAERLAHLLENDFPVGFSVGFRPLKVEEITNDEGELVGLKMLEIDLLEASAVGIPSQPDSVPVGINTNSTEAAVAVKSVLDKADGEVDIDELKESLSKSMLKGEDDMGDQKDDGDSGDTPEQNDSKPENENDGKDQAEQVKDLVKEALDEHEKSPHYLKTFEEALKEVEKFEDDEIEEIMAVVGGTISSKMNEAMEEIADELSAEGGDDEEENEMDEDEDEDEEENSSEPDEEDGEDGEKETDEDEEDEDDEDKGLDDDQMTDPDKSTGPKGTGPMTTDGDEKGEDGPDSVELSDELSEDELEELGFGGRP